MADPTRPGAVSFKGAGGSIHGSQTRRVFETVIAAAGRTTGYARRAGGRCDLRWAVPRLRTSSRRPQDLVLYLQPPVLAMFAANRRGRRIADLEPQLQKLDLVFPSASKLSSIRLAEDSGAGHRPAHALVAACWVVPSSCSSASPSPMEVPQHPGSIPRGCSECEAFGQGEFITWR